MEAEVILNKLYKLFIINPSLHNSYCVCDVVPYHKNKETSTINVLIYRKMPGIDQDTFEWSPFIDPFVFLNISTTYLYNESWREAIYKTNGLDRQTKLYGLFLEDPDTDYSKWLEKQWKLISLKNIK